MEQNKKLKRYSLFLAFGLIALIAALVLRGPHISNAMKKMILPELEAASGKKVIAGKIYVNIFPLFVEAKDLKAFDDDGRRILFVRRAKAYLDISGLFGRSLTIRRLVIKEPALDLTQEQAGSIEKSLRAYLARQRKDALKVKVLAVELQQGRASVDFPGLRSSALVEGFKGEAIISSDMQRIRADAASVIFRREGLPEISAGLSAHFLIKDGALSIKRLELNAAGTHAVAEGGAAAGEAKISTAADVLVSSFKKIFGLKKSGDGSIRVDGAIEYRKEVLLDLAISGDLYLETLMELLEVNEKLEGRVVFSSSVKGPLKDIRSEGKATMTKGNLYNVEIDTVTCRIVYEKGRMSFLDGSGRLYHGSAKASASITLPVVNNFTLDIDFSDADSKPLFKLIGWDPGVPAGKVNGVLHHDGEYFGPKGNFAYRAVESGSDILGRVKEMTGNYDLSGDILGLSDIHIRTGHSEAAAEGTVDIEKELLDLRTVIRTTDLHEVTAPYYEHLKGGGEFTGKVTGTFDDPIVSGKVKTVNAAIEAYPAGVINADMIYSKNLLQVKELSAGGPNGSVMLSGIIAFREAKQLFDLTHPLWGLRASLKNVDAGKFVKIFYPDFSGSGRFAASVQLEGTGKLPGVAADVSLEKSVIFGVPVNSASFNFRYALSKLEFTRMSVKQGESTVNGSFTIHPDDSFSYSAASDRIRLSDIIQRPLQGEVVAGMTSEGKGRFDNPELTVEAKIIEGTLKGKPAGRGVLSASLKDHEFAAKAKLINDRLTLTAKGRTDGIMPWEASADIQTGRYDFLLTSILKDVPEDLILSLNGSISLHGTKNHVHGNALLKHVVMSMYGYSFTNQDDISVELKDRELSLGSITMKSGDARLHAGGSLVIGKSYNVNIEGQSALSPFKSFSSKLGVLKGDAEFIVGISGEWDRPKINGGINLVNGAIGLKDYPSHRITALAGYLYMDSDKVVLRSLAGKLGGGDITLSGILYLKKFTFSRFYVEASLNNITSSISNDFSVNYDGNILYKGTAASQVVSGNLYINRASYRERVEWKSWLLQTRKTEKFKSEISNLEKAGLNIKIAGKDTILIDNNVARARVSADMVLRGTVYRPVLFGRLETSEGKVFFRNNEFRIIHASTDFADHQRLNPLISIAAETIVKGYKIKMNLEGQLDHFNMSLSSDPPLKEMDVLALLTVGQTSGGTKGLEGGIGASEATSFVTGKLQDVIEERLRSLTGLDRFQVDPYVSKTTGMVEPRVTVSKRMLSDKFFVTYATALGTKEEQLIKLEYFMGKNVSLVGVRDERGIIGGDIRFRFEFR